MENTDYISVGKLRKPHGIHGAFGFLFEKELKKKTNLPLHFFLEKNNHFLPFFIEKIEQTTFDAGFIKFEEISNPEEAKKWSTSDLYLIATDVKKYFKDEKNDFDFILHFTVNTDSGIIGTIINIEEMPGQLMMTIENKDKEEIFIPLVEDWIVAIDKKRKIVQLTLPEGILDI